MKIQLSFFVMLLREKMYSLLHSQYSLILFAEIDCSKIHGDAMNKFRATLTLRF